MKRQHTRAEVAIVGAGPAGSFTAWRLASAGARVLLFDPSHPREKPCGGGVTGSALALVAPAVSTASMGAPIRAARFVDSTSGSEAAVPFKPDGSDLVVVSRASFDAALLRAAQNAGATLIPERVADIERTATGMTVTTARGLRESAALVVGADGANSLVRRRLARAFTRAELSIATGFYAHGATGDEVIIEFVPDPPGYLWSFPRPDHLAIGICAQADAGVTPESLRARVATWIDQSRSIPRGLRLEPYSWPIPSLRPRDLSRLDLSGPGFFLLGDAAGLVDPITREGIFFALQSAEMAATAILNDQAAPEAAYSARIRREIVPELLRAARLKAGFFTPQFTRLLVHALSVSPAVARVMADLAAGKQSYSGLKWRLLSTLEWRLAWRLLRLETGRSPLPA